MRSGEKLLRGVGGGADVAVENEDADDDDHQSRQKRREAAVLRTRLGVVANIIL
jgi:hypothetical protein